MSGEKGKVFIVEDDFTSKIGLAGLLQKEGLEVVSGKGPDPIPQIVAAKPDIIVTDIDTDPNASPTDTIEKMKNMPELKGVEIFVYTGNLDVSLEVKLRKLKLSSYFTKDEAHVDSLVGSAKQYFVKEETAIDYYAEFDDVGERGAPAARPAAPAPKETFEEMFDEFTEKVHKNLEAEGGGGETFYNLGVSYMEMGLMQEAAKEFEEAAKDPQFKLEAISMSGICLRNLKKYAEAVAKFQEGSKTTTDPVEIMGFRYEIGVTLQEMGRLKDAFNYLGAVYKADKTYRDVTKRLVEVNNALKAGQK
ncbi:MAG: response regulator [Nitrospinae bacterium]|nr:response regulator [Nitrospinota bacterium]